MPKPVVPAKLTVDFSNVGERREGGKSIHVPEGDYVLRVQACDLRSKKDDETSKYLAWKLDIAKPSKYTGKGFIYHNTSLKEESLWSLRNFLEDLGVKVPNSKVGIPIQAIVAKKMLIGATLEDDEYNEKLKSKISATFKASEYEDTGEEETEEESEEESEEEESEDEELEEIDVDDL